jgi:hypothetical protein
LYIFGGCGVCFSLHVVVVVVVVALVFGFGTYGMGLAFM